MTLTPRFTLWLEMLAERDRSLLTLFLLTFAVVLFVYQTRRWLWQGVAVFWWMLGVFLVISPISIPRPTFGILLDQPLWYDETFTVAVSRLPFDRMLQAVAGDVHPPLWYVIEWVIVRLLGDSAWALRLPSLLLALASVGLTYRLARSLGHERKTALWAAGLLALMPAQVYYAQEARMYALLQFCLLVAVLGLVECRPWVMGLGVLGVLYTHNLGLIFVVVIGLLALWQEWKSHASGVKVAVPAAAGRHHWWKADLASSWRLSPHRHVLELWAVGQVVLLAWWPWLRVALAQARNVGAGFWVQDAGLGGYLLPLYRLTLGMGVVDFIEQHAAVTAVGLGALALWAALRDRERGVVPLALVVGPALLLVLVSELWRPLYLERVFIAALPMLAILAAAALRRLRPVHRAPVLAVLSPVLLLCLLFQSKGTAGYDVFARNILDEYQEGDVIYHANLASYIQLSYYLPDADHVCWPDAGNLQQALTKETQKAMNIQRAEAAEVWDGERRLLVVGMLHPLTTKGEEKALEAALKLGQTEKLVTWKETELVTAGMWEVKP